MSRPNLQVVFRFPSEFDLLFTYLTRQEEVLAKQGQPMLEYDILMGEHEVTVDFKMSKDDWENPLGLNDV
jgi:hypothetical protein